MWIEHVEDWLGKPVVGPDGEKIGKLEDLVFAGDGTPLFGAVSTGLFGRRVSLVPLSQAALAPDHVLVPYDKALVKDAPQLDDAGTLSLEVEDATATHYGQPLRGRVEGEEYLTASERVRLTEQARAAGERARALEDHAAELGVAAEDARQESLAATERADSLHHEHESALARAREARDEQAAILS